MTDSEVRRMARVPETLCDLAADCLAAAQDVSDTWSAEQTTLALANGSAGNTGGGSSLLTAHGSASDQAGTFMSRLSGTLEQDMDDIYGCAFTWSSTDEDAARAAESSYPLPAEPSPGPSPEPFPEDEPDEPEPEPEPDPEPQPTPAPSELPSPDNYPRRD